MVKFRRRSDDGGSSKDHALPFLTTAEADHVRFLLRQALAERGREVTVHADHVRDDQGSEFGLWNVAAACHSEPRGEAAWGQVVAKHVTSVLAHADRQDLGRLTPEDVRSRTHAKLSAASDFPPHPNRPGLSYLAKPVPGLLETLVVDFPDAAVILTDSEIERFGGLVTLREAGLANLRALPVEERKHVAARGGGTFDVLLEGSIYTASRVLVMADLMTQMLGPVDGRYGVLAAMPGRDRVAIHVMGGHPIVPSLHLMARFALASISDAPGPLSPNVFWWRHGAWTQMTHLESDGTISVPPNPELIQLIEKLDGR